MGDLQKALQRFEKGMSRISKSGNPTGKVRILYHMGNCYRLLGQDKQARITYDEAVEEVERQAKHMLDEKSRYHFFAYFNGMMTTIQSMLFDCGAFEEALLMAEATRWRTSIEALQKKDSQFKDTDMNKTTMDTFRSVAERMDSFILYYSHVNSDYLHSDGSVRIQEEMIIYLISKTGIEKAVKRVFTKEINDAIGAVLMYLIIREEKSLLRFEGVLGPLLQQKDGDDKSVLVGAVANEDNEELRNSTQFRKINMRDSSERPESFEHLKTVLSSLYDWLLGSIDDYLSANEWKPVIIVPSKELHLIPFGALFDKRTEKYFIEKCTFSFASSITLWQMTTQNKTIRSISRENEANRALIIGNPQPMSGKFSPLKYAAIEAEEIAAKLNCPMVPCNEATVEYVQQRLPECYLGHFATHGILDENTDNPDAYLFGGLVLRKEISNDSESGVLWGTKIASMDLRHVQMVVMSACETMLGRVNTEGVAGLGRAFMTAGVRTVIATLWPVHDENTKDIMVCFYDQWSQGKSALVALRHAILENINKNYNTPHKWAAFVLFGDPETSAWQN